MARKVLEHVQPETFAEIRDKAGVKNVELARELGVSPTRVTELTRTKGGTSRQLKRVREAITSIRGRRRADRVAKPGRSRTSRTGGRSLRSLERSRSRSSRAAASA